MVSSEPEIELAAGFSEELSHLYESARPLAWLPATERLSRIRADRWIGCTRATRALARL